MVKQYQKLIALEAELNLTKDALEALAELAVREEPVLGSSFNF